MKKTSHIIDQNCLHDLMINEYILSNNLPGLNIYIQASVHGAELQGSLVIKELVAMLKDIEIHGTISLIPLANPYATSQKIGTYTYGRFNPVTGDNWNRLYYNLISNKTSAFSINIEDFTKEIINRSEAEIISSFKKEIANKLDSYLLDQEKFGVSDNKYLFCTLQKLAANADIVLDLHTGPIATRYLYAPEDLKEKSIDLNSPFTLLIPAEFGGAMDEATYYPWHCLKTELKKHGKSLSYEFESYTVELGSEEVISISEAKKDALNIMNFLYRRGVIKTDPKIQKEKKVFCKLKDYRTYRAKASGLCEYKVAPGHSFKQNDVLATIHFLANLENSYESQSVDVIALEDGVVINHTPSANVKKGMDLIQCFSNTL